MGWLSCPALTTDGQQIHPSLSESLDHSSRLQKNIRVSALFVCLHSIVLGSLHDAHTLIYRRYRSLAAVMMVLATG